ncbi:toxin [Candidatus Saccharibacteria bacterium]|nr:toxin [Candidatus Saccharibacteria bacterium]NIV71737.1 toxin [Calditrichia bacterium]NIW78706.1 toxin [Calditrichia bacterium]
MIWDEYKNLKLKNERNISFERIAELIMEQKFIDILEHPKETNQQIVVLEINQYKYAVPFVIDEDDNIILKTAYPGRKLHKKYGGKK